MGAWGTAIFSDDTAADVRDMFTDFIAEGLSPRQATFRLIDESADILEDEDEACVLWISLAATQWKLGRMVDSVRKRAMKIIDSGTDLRRWEDNSKAEIEQRKKHLEKLRTQLLSPAPEPKKVRKRPKSTTDFLMGDIATYRLDDDIAVRFCVIKIWGDRGGFYANICLLGLEDGKPFKKKTLKLADTLGPHYTMLMHEPADRVKLIKRGIGIPKETSESLKAWNNLKVDGHCCKWDDFPAALREVFPKLGWS